MAFVHNGIIIPEDTANALTVNGVDVTDVFMNGVQIWNQSLFSATWSGNSTDPSYGGGYKLQVILSDFMLDFMLKLVLWSQLIQMEFLVGIVLPAHL